MDADHFLLYNGVRFSKFSEILMTSSESIISSQASFMLNGEVISVSIASDLMPSDGRDSEFGNGKVGEPGRAESDLDWSDAS